MNQPFRPFTQQPAMIDPFGRHVTYLRVSVTDRCDFRCSYCMSEHMSFLPKKDLLSLEELDRVCSAFVAKGVRKLRITGGEPLVRKNIMWLFRALSRHLDGGGLDELTLTTNGSQLPKFAQELKDAGVRRINISVDTLKADRFKAITRWGDLNQVMAGVDAAEKAGLAIKLNAVALKGMNEDEIEDLISFAHGRGFDLTLIETMPMGEIDGDRTDQYLPLSIVRARLMDRWTLEDIPHRTGGPCPLRAHQGDRRTARLHHADDPQLLRKLQPGAADLHGHALHVSRPGRRRRPARPPARLARGYTADASHRRGDLAQAQGPRFHHRPAHQAARRSAAHERDRRLSDRPRGVNGEPATQ
jgi:molybdenum cofactor biosynthesis enzyme MoaA